MIETLHAALVDARGRVIAVVRDYVVRAGAADRVNAFTHESVPFDVATDLRLVEELRRDGQVVRVVDRRVIRYSVEVRR